MPAPIVAPAAPAAPNAPSQTPNIAPPKPVVPTPVAKPPAAAAPTAEPLFEVKVDGEVKKYTRAEAERLLSKSGFADKGVRQVREALAAIKAREAELTERESVWDDDEKLEAELLKRGKLDPLARKRLAVKVAEAEMTPEQKAQQRADEAEAKLAKLEQAGKDEQEQKRLTESSQKLYVHIEDTLASAAERAGIGRDPDSFYAVYEAMTEFRDLGLIDPNQFTPAIADRICEAALENIAATDKRREASVLKGLKGKALVERLGKTVVDEVLRHKLEELRGGGPKKAAPIIPNGNGNGAPKSNFITVDEARAQMDEMKKRAGR